MFLHNGKEAKCLMYQNMFYFCHKHFCYCFKKIFVCLIISFSCGDAKFSSANVMVRHRLRVWNFESQSKVWLVMVRKMFLLWTFLLMNYQWNLFWSYSLVQLGHSCLNGTPAFMVSKNICWKMRLAMYIRLYLGNAEE